MDKGDVPPLKNENYHGQPENEMKNKTDEMMVKSKVVLCIVQYLQYQIIIYYLSINKCMDYNYADKHSLNVNA